MEGLHKEKENEMNYMDFQPYVIRERNEQMRGEIDSLRLQERLRGNRQSSGSRFVALARTGVMPLLRAARLAG